MRQLKANYILFVFFASFCNYSEGTEPQWSFTGESGPNNWGGWCNLGQSQSPVNLKNQVFEKNLKTNPIVFTG